MIYYECPNAPNDHEHENLISIFLAGGLTGCPDWQQRVVRELKGLPCVILNPRRQGMSLWNDEDTQQQIEWEFNMMEKADVILFYFPADSICPIALYELGRWNALGESRNKKIIISVHADYQRKMDVIIQTQLATGEDKVLEGLTSLIHETGQYIRSHAKL